MSTLSGFGAAKQAVEEAQKNGTQGNFEKFKIEKNAPAKTVRFLVLDNDDSVTTFTEHWTTMNNGYKRNFACPNAKIGEDNCIICRAKRGTDYAEDTRKTAHMINVIDREDNKVRVWKFSAMPMAQLLEILNSVGNVSDRDYNIRFLENDGEFKNENIKAKFYYEILPATETPVELTEADKEVAKSRYDLLTLTPPYDEESLGKVMAMKPGEGQKRPNSSTVLPSANDFLAKIKAGGTTTTTEAPVASTESASTEAGEDFNALLKQLQGNS